jgi:hypothetical protein
MILYAERSTLLYNVVAVQYIINRAERYIFFDERRTDNRKASPSVYNTSY